MRKNKKLLDSFVKYCKENPELRFWQALRNWSKYSFVFGIKTSKVWTERSIEELSNEYPDLEDTFYKEDQ